MLSLKNILLIVTLGCISASAKKYIPESGGFQPIQNRYFETSIQTANNYSLVDGKEKEGKELKGSRDPSDKLRFGTLTTTYGNTGSAVNGVGYPLKIDIGAIALGALIGLGAVLIVPKLTHIFSTGGSQGNYGYRSLDTEMSSITDLLSRLDNSLDQHNIDSSSCVQRIVCSYVHGSQKNVQHGEANTMEQLVYSISNNPLFSYLLDGSSIKQAIDMGKQADQEKCAALYTKCPVNRDNFMQVIARLLPV